MTPLAALLLLAQLAGGSARVLGEALGPRGEPWAGARITLIARPVPWREDVGELHQVAAVAAADGSFVAELQSGLEYSVWAQAPAADVPQRFSAVAEQVVAGGFVRLRAEPEGRQPLRITVAGLAPWRATGRPPYVRVVWPTETVFHRCGALDEHGTATLPPVPGRSVLVQVLSGDDILVVSRTIDPATGPDVRLDLPRPQPRRVAFERPDGVRLAGAMVRFAAPLRVPAASIGFDPDAREWHSWGRTLVPGPDGILAVQVPESAGAPVELLVQAPGAARTRRWLDASGPHSGVREAPDQEAPRLIAEVGPEQCLRGRILCGPGLPASGLRVYAWHTVAFRQLVTTGSTAADGRFELTGLQPGEWFNLLALTSELPPAPPGTGAASGVPQAPVTLLALGATGTGRAHDLGDLPLDRLCRVRVTVRDPGGQPASDVRLRWYAGVLSSGRWRFGSNEVGVADRLGRLELLTTCATGGVLAIAPGAYSVADWRAARPALDLALQPLLPVRGRVRNPEGQPIAGAVVMVGFFRGNSGGGFQERAREDLNYLTLHGRSGADGGFQLGFLPLPGWQLRLAAWLPGWGLRSPDGPLLEAEPMDGIELVLPAPATDARQGR